MDPLWSMSRITCQRLIRLLEGLEPDLNLASTLLMLKDQIPKKSKEAARKFIRKIVEEINRLLGIGA